MSIRIFLTTDNHVGYNETDPVQGDDAARTFDEAMTIAQGAGVDLAIQGGDLFHVNKPSKRSLYSVIRTLRKSCLGDKPVEFEVLNHGPLALDGADDFDYPNFEDPNLNVALPVFAISGNHDDAGGAVGSSMLSPLDVLSMAGLVNHFGRVYDSADIVVKPVLIEKAGIRLALYGLASVRDERLYRTFRDNKVKFLRPRTEPDSYYNILVVHQNRTAHGPTNFLPPEFLPNFVDLVIWGHEHECLIDPQPNLSKGFSIMQPGSTVITSLSESETKPKHVAVLSIGPNKTFSCEKIPLKTVRPFAMRTVSLAEDTNISPQDRDARAKVSEWLIGQVDELIEEAKMGWIEQHGMEDEHAIDDAPLPLVRLRVDYTGYDIENTTRFSNRFIGRVANTTNILSLIKRRDAGTRLGPRTSSAGIATGRPVNNIKQVGQLVHEILTSETLEVLPEREMGEALSRFVEKDEKLALREGVDEIVKSKITQLMESVDDLAIDSPEAEDIPPTTTAQGFPPLPALGETLPEQLPQQMPVEPQHEEPSLSDDDEDSDLDAVISSFEESSQRQPHKDPASTSRARPEPELPPRSGGNARGARPARSSRATFESQPSPAPNDGNDYDDDDSDEMFSS